eukprot:7455804-Pyramimonas_sp.AAC.1
MQFLRFRARAPPPEKLRPSAEMVPPEAPSELQTAHAWDFASKSLSLSREPEPSDPAGATVAC